MDVLIISPTYNGYALEIFRTRAWRQPRQPTGISNTIAPLTSHAMRHRRRRAVRSPTSPNITPTLAAGCHGDGRRDSDGCVAPSGQETTAATSSLVFISPPNSYRLKQRINQSRLKVNLRDDQVLETIPALPSPSGSSPSASPSASVYLVPGVAIHDTGAYSRLARTNLKDYSCIERESSANTSSRY